MSSKLALDELRAQLAARGLPTSGIKPTLVRRLDSALQNEEMKSKDAQKMASSVAGKRKREQQSGGSPETGNVESLERLNGMNIRELREQAVLVGISTNGSKRELVARLKEHMEKDMEETTEGTGNVESLERLNGMNIRELREQAVLVGISTNGSKRELVARLKEHMEKDMEETTEDMGENEDGKEKLITATKKGGAVLDQWLPDDIKLNYHVLERGDEVYDAILNQTNVGENNNKFYVIQVLESDAGGMFMVYNRWGRVGVKGQDKLHGPFISQENAIDDFQHKFFAKTRNHWFNRKEFISYPKCYTWLEMDYSQAEKAVVNSPDNAIIGIQPRETKLEPQIAKFISLICNISMMQQQMLEIGYNAEKLPLGKLSKATILKGYDVLKRISDAIGQSERKKLELLSGEFYTVIPHDFGFKKMREFIIDTPSKLKRKLEMVEALAEIELATKLLKDDLEMQEDPLYSHYQRLCCQLTPLEIDSVEFSMVERYMQNTHAKTHSNYTVDIVHIFKVSRKGEAERFKKFSCMQNRMLLWHGSRLTNWTGILSQGLRIAPPEAPVTGYMFGKGVYFADMFSKSANYCLPSRTSQTGVLLLCEVALGEMVELLTAKYDADQLPEGKLSTKGVGTSAPDSSASQSLEDGVVVPLGQPKEQPGPKGSLLYNEYIVYNTDQIRMRYVVRVNFNFKY